MKNAIKAAEVFEHLIILSRGLAPSSSLFFAKVFIVFSCTLPKVACFQNFLLTRLDFCGNLFQQFNITYLLRVPARLPKEPEQVFNFLSLHNEPESRPSRKGWSGSGRCVAIFYCQIQHRYLDNRMTVCMGYPAMTPKGSTDDCANRRSKEEVLAQHSNFCK